MATEPSFRSIPRRQFLALGAGAAAAAGVGTSAAAPPRTRFYAGCAAMADRSGHVAVLFDETGAILFRTPLAHRGHDMAVHPAGHELVVFSRRPETTMWVLDIASGRTIHRVDTRADRHLYGHGVFSQDGRTLMATENDFTTGRGVLGLYDAAADYRRIGELPTFGIGPHQVLGMPTGGRMVVANGGIRTHPDTGRSKLNIAEMAPSLCILDPPTGRMESRVRAPDRLHKLSIRHIDVNRSGLIAFAMQYEGDRRDRVPLVGLSDGGDIRFLSNGAMDRPMRHYTGGISFDSSGTLLAVSAPRGDRVGVWNVRTGTPAGVIPATDASGIAPVTQAGAFMIAGGDGTLRRGSAGHTSAVLRPADGRMRWDNHLTAL